ncbi:MAG: type II secretion system F family protein [Pseudomonadales bacterium]|nr:type II secretion system F family protein [Pseudomonadales bacterium]
MSLFEYHAKDSQGQSFHGEMEGSSASLIARQLTDSGAIPLNIREVKIEVSDAQKFKLDWLKKNKVNLDEMILFSRQMRSLMRAGIPIVRAIRGLSSSSQNPHFSSILSEIADSLESGMDLATSLKQHDGVFSHLYVSVIFVGENTGKLDMAFQHIAKHLDLERETLKRIKSATRYPTFVLVAIGIAIVILNMFVIPAFAGVFAKFGAELPWQTQVILAVSNFFVEYWVVLLLFLGGVLYGGKRYLNTDAGRLKWDEKKLRMPVLGKIFERINLSRFCQSFAIVLDSGIPVTNGLTVVEGSVGNLYMESKIGDMRKSIERGDSILNAATATNMFTPVVLQMMAVGEESGTMVELLDEAASFYTEEVDYALQGLTEAIEPLLIIAIGAMVLVMALGVFLPLWDLSGVAAG